MNADDMGSGKARNALPFQKAAASFSSLRFPLKKEVGGGRSRLSGGT